MNQSALLRPDWTPATVALMILGFVVFWPLGLAMLAYILFGDRFRDLKRDANGKLDGMVAAFRKTGFGTTERHFGGTGNVAFDEWRTAELERIESERRKLEAMREEFDTYMRELRMAKDREEFDRFMRERGRGSSNAPGHGNA